MVATEQQLKDAIARIDSVLAQVSLPRIQHAQLAQDLQLVQEKVQGWYRLDKQIHDQLTEIKRLEDLTHERTDICTNDD